MCGGDRSDSDATNCPAKFTLNFGVRLNLEGNFHSGGVLVFSSFCQDASSNETIVGNGVTREQLTRMDRGTLCIEPCQVFGGRRAVGIIWIGSLAIQMIR